MKKINNQVLVIFGASGDLTERKLIPALYNLYLRGFLSDQFAILGTSRTQLDDQSFRDKVIYNSRFIGGDSQEDQEKQASFAEMLFYNCMDTTNAEDFQGLRQRIDEVCKSKDCDTNVIYYLSTPPSLYAPVSKQLAGAGLNQEENGWKRLIVEKPFGYDLESAVKLNSELLDCFREDQIYRIDHYLGKETVQNLLVARFSNTIFEPLWNRNYIDRIEITSAEKEGIGTRGKYYDGSGALRDMIQNHLLQLISHVAMEPPPKLDADCIRNEKLKLFQSIRPLSPEDIRQDTIRGQYMESVVDEEKIKGYREEDGVDPNSRTETYAAIKFYIDNWRWAGVPFYIRTGKRLPTRVSEVVIHFKPNHTHLFPSNHGKNTNILVFRIQPNEGVLLKYLLKVPGSGFEVEQVNMDFQYDQLTDSYLPDAYERLLLDCMQGDATLFARGDSVLAAWEFIDPILKQWATDPEIPVYGYPAGTWGPIQAEEMVEWRNPCKNLTDDGLYCEL